MKRGLAALVIFCFCIALSVYCSDKSKKALESAGKDISEIFILCENGENEEALSKAYKTESEWKENDFILKITLERSALKEIETAVSYIPELIKSGETDKAEEQCSQAIFEIGYLLEGEKLSFENIF